MTWTNLHALCERGQPESIIQESRQHPEQVLFTDDHGSTPLHCLVWRNPDIHAVHALLDACPPTASLQDYHGNLPLHVAVSSPGNNDNKALLQLLLTANPDAIAMANREGLLPLHMALRHAPHNKDVIDLLVESDPDALTRRIKVRLGFVKCNIEDFDIAA
jgi:ankyrin repeat protein